MSPGVEPKKAEDSRRMGKLKKNTGRDWSGDQASIPNVGRRIVKLESG